MSKSLSISNEEHEREVLAHRKARLARLTAKDSWLTLIGKNWIHEGKSTIGSDHACTVHLPEGKAPPVLGTFDLEGDTISFAPVETAGLKLRLGANGEERPLIEKVTLATDQKGTPDKILLGTLSIEVMQRGATFAIRSRDAESDARTNFPGIAHFPIDPSFRIVAKLERYPEPKIIELQYESGDHETYRCEASAVFERNGVTYRVDPVVDGPRPRLFLLFWDETARRETYGSGRFLYAPLPEGDEVVLDFNQAFNPPCAFTPYAACPLPPPQNRLMLRIEAGEKRPLEIP